MNGSFFKHLLLYVCSIALSVFTLHSLIIQAFPEMVLDILDALTGISVIFSVYYIAKDFGRLSTFLIGKIDKNSMIYRLLADYHFGTMAFASLGLIFSVFYIGLNFFYGLRSHFFWYLAMSAFYILLIILKLVILLGAKKVSNKESDGYGQYDRKLYINTGKSIIATAFIFVGVYAALMNNDVESKTTGAMIYIVALYTFYKLGLAVKNLFKAVGQASYLVKAIRNVGIIEAIMAVFHLQIVMELEFGELSHMKLFNTYVAAIIYILFLGLGIFMIVKGNHR